MESLTFRNTKMSDLQEFADSLERYEGDFLSTIKQPKSAKSLWADIYFYLIGDPMKTKDNKIRAYIKRELEDNEGKEKKRYNKFRHFSFKPIKQSDKKQVKFYNLSDLPRKETTKISHKDLKTVLNISDDIINHSHQKSRSRFYNDL